MKKEKISLGAAQMEMRLAINRAHQIRSLKNMCNSNEDKGINYSSLITKKTNKKFEKQTFRLFAETPIANEIERDAKKVKLCTCNISSHRPL